MCIYKDSGGGLLKPDKVASPASGAIVLMGLLEYAVSAFMGMTFLIWLTFYTD
jgi:hypothetical protein